jgi:zinc transport system substrate-binding protein
MSSVVEAVGGDDVKVQTVVPFGMCPGHFDLTPSQARSMRESDLLLYHGFERFLDGFEMKEDRNAVRVAVKGNWMIPHIHTQAVEKVSGILGTTDAGSAQSYEARAAAYARAVNKTAAASRRLLAGMEGLRVISAKMNRDLVKWMGFEVISTFPRDEDISVRDMHRLIREGREKKTAAVIDNSQSSGKVGFIVAKELGVPFVSISNFPDPETAGDAGRPYTGTLIANSRKIKAALGEKSDGRE